MSVDSSYTSGGFTSGLSNTEPSITGATLTTLASLDETARRGAVLFSSPAAVPPPLVLGGGMVPPPLGAAAAQGKRRRASAGALPIHVPSPSSSDDCRKRPRSDPGRRVAWAAGCTSPRPSRERLHKQARALSDAECGAGPSGGDAAHDGAAQAEPPGPGGEPLPRSASGRARRAPAGWELL